MDEIEKRITALELEYEKNKIQVGLLASQVVSEKGTLQRQGDRLRNEVKIVEDRIQKTLYNGDGVVIQVDRLKRDAERASKYFDENVQAIVDERINQILDGEDGITIQLDRLKENKKEQDRRNERFMAFIIAASSAIFGIMCKIIFDLITKN